MRKILTVLALLGLWCYSGARADQTVGPSNLIVCNKSTSITAAAAGTQQAIAGSAGQAIQLCGWEVTSGLASGTVTTFQLEYGTGAACTTPTTLTPALNITSTAPSVDRLTYAWVSIPTGATVCLVTTGATVSIAAIVYYAQF